MLRKMSRRFKNMHLRTKLSLVIVGTMLLILSVNSIMYLILNRMTQQLDDIYVGNVKLNELEDVERIGFSQKETLTVLQVAREMILRGYEVSPAED